MATNKVVLANGETLIDLSNDSITPRTMAAGTTAHDSTGALIVGTATEVELAQETGDSETAVMSQKAVTDITDQLSEEIADYNWFTSGTQIPANSDLDSYTTSGKYYVASTAISKTILNAPVTNTNYVLYVIVRTTSKSITQIIFTLNNKICMRSATSSGALSDWETFATEDWVQEQLNALKAQGVQQVPLFANSIEECTDQSKMYVLPDGYIYAYMKTTTTTEGESVPNFTNLMDNPDASVKTGVRYSQSGAASGTPWKSETGDTSIIIPMTSVKPTIRVRGAGNDAKYNNYIYVSYDGKEIFPITPEHTRTVEANGDITIAVTTTLSTPKYATFAVASGFNADELIVTVDQPITYTTTEGGTVTTEQWSNTGLAFVPADYENRIIAVENKAEENADKISALEDEMNKPKSTGIITMFISPTGNDSNNGLTAISPKKTVKACVDAGATRISAKRGVYNEKITLSNVDSFEIFPTDNDYTFDANVKRYPPIVFDTSHTIAVSSLSAYNSIKKVSYSETNAAFSYTFGNSLFDKVYSTSHGYHAVLWMITGNIKNDFKLKPMATIAEVEATANSFTWVNNVIYLNADLTNVTEIRVPTIYDNALTVFTANRVKLTDVEIAFAGRYSLLVENCPNVEVDNCSVKYSSNGSGFDFKNVNGILRNCYASRVHDGYGIGDYGHTIFVDCVAEWCFDDGMSHHRGCTGTVIGGRYEGNVKAGNCPAHGANVNIYGGLYKDNGLWGIAYWYENTYNPCTGMVQGAVMVGNPKGLVVDAGSSVTALNCHYVGNTKDKEITGTLIEY